MSKAAPYDDAGEFIRRNCLRDGFLVRYFSEGEFWEWNGGFYEVLPLARLNEEIWKFLHHAKVRTKSGEGFERFRPKQSNVDEVVRALKARLGLHIAAPCWLGEVGEGVVEEVEGEVKTRDVLVFKNGLVDIASGRLRPLTPRLWVKSGVDFEFDPEARCPTWERFLGEVFPGDEVSRDCVEEQLGLGMTEDVRFHKAALWVGGGRNGKGTLAFVQERLVGSAAYVSLSFSTWMSTENSGACMIGKRVGVFPDVRLRPGKWYGQNYDPGGLDHKSKEQVLKITGGDKVTLGVKYRPQPWEGVLPMKMILISNEVPNFNDPQLSSRFIKVAFRVSFRDREDLFLKEKLAAELPGIANRCLAAYRRLCRRGGFEQPESGLKLERAVVASSNPYAAFVQDRCVLEAGAEVACDVLYKKFRGWCEENGREDLLKTVKASKHLTPKLKLNTLVRTVLTLVRMKRVF